MKTKYFNRYSLPKDKKDHLSTLTKLDDIQFQIIEDITKEQNAVRKLTNLEIRDLVEKTKLSAENVIDAAVAFKWVLGFFSLEVKDNLEDLIEDLIETVKDIIDDRDKLKERLNKISNLVPQFRPLYKSEIAKSDGVPLLRRSNGSVILKPIFDERFDFDEMDIKSYKPKLIKRIACVLLELKNTSDQTFTVQLDAREFEQLLNELIALQIELKSFENECN